MANEFTELFFFFLYNKSWHTGELKITRGKNTSVLSVFKCVHMGIQETTQQLVQLTFRAITDKQSKNVLGKLVKTRTQFNAF